MTLFERVAGLILGIPRVYEGSADGLCKRRFFEDHNLPANAHFLRDAWRAMVQAAGRHQRSPQDFTFVFFVVSENAREV